MFLLDIPNKVQQEFLKIHQNLCNGFWNGPILRFYFFQISSEFPSFSYYIPLMRGKQRNETRWPRSRRSGLYFSLIQLIFIFGKTIASTKRINKRKSKTLLLDFFKKRYKKAKISPEKGWWGGGRTIFKYKRKHSYRTKKQYDKISEVVLWVFGTLLKIWNHKTVNYNQ